MELRLWKVNIYTEKQLMKLKQYPDLNQGTLTCRFYCNMIHHWHQETYNSNVNLTMSDVYDWWHCLLLAQSLMALRASRKFSILGTSLKISSVTRHPFRLRTHFWSRFFSKLSARRSCNTVKNQSEKYVNRHLVSHLEWNMIRNNLWNVTSLTISMLL
jgi:hypothetical protein